MEKGINNRITYYRQKCKLSQREVAEKVGMKSNAYSRAEREGNIPCNMAIKLAEIFEIDVKELLYENPVEDNLRVLENYRKQLDFDEILSPSIPILAMHGYETQLLTMFKRCNPEKQKTIMECVFSIYKSNLY
jgi:transcriptional regulator with XRE-family HTH domain